MQLSQEMKICLISVVDSVSWNIYEQYAKQLESSGYHHKAATFYLTNNKVYEAVNMLASNGLYKLVMLH